MISPSTPLWPAANMPTASRPHAPQMPCTVIAPTGSSTFSTSFTKWTPAIMMTPASSPITTAAHGSTYAHGAVIPTRPARAPFAPISMSALPVRIMAM